MFIDEADAFLRKRKTEYNLSENLRNAINTFLYKTGSQSDKYMLILATNTPEQLDEAILDRVDELVMFDKPRQQERINMLYHYLVMYCNPPKTVYEKMKFLWKHPKSLITGKKLIGMEGVSADVIERLAKKAEGFSGREIVKMVVAWHDAAFALDKPILNPDLMEKILDRLRGMHEVKHGWSDKETEILSKIQSPELVARAYEDSSPKSQKDEVKKIEDPQKK